MSLVKNTLSPNWPLVCVDITVLVERSEVRNVRVGQAVREDAHKPGGVVARGWVYERLWDRRCMRTMPVTTP